MVRILNVQDFAENIRALLGDFKRFPEEIIVTDQDQALMKLVPMFHAPAARPIFGCMRGSVTINGDIVGSTEVSWDASE